MSQTQIEYEKFITVAKRILKSQLSTNYETLSGYREQIINAYNEFIHFVAINYDKVNKTGQIILDNKAEDVREKFERCLSALNCTYQLPNSVFEIVNEASISQVQSGESSLQQFPIATTSIEGRKSPILVEINSSLQTLKREEQENLERERRRQEIEEKQRQERKTNENLERQERERKRKEKEEHEKRVNMEEQLKAQRELLDMVNKQIRNSYSGDPLGLPTFLSGVEIVQDFATNDNLKRKMVIYVKGRLEGRAREIITDDIETIEELLEKLKQDIKPENSKIIEGRMAALRYSYVKQEEFAARTEELADALRRTLIIEGMTPAKANEMTIDRTIQLCKKSTTSDVVKAVLGAATFHTAKEVVAKLITSNDECVKDRQVLRYQKDKGHMRGKFNHRGRGNQGFRNGFNNRGGRNNYGNNYGGFNNYRNNNSYGGRGGYRGRGGNYSGRGKYANGNSNGGNWRVNQNPNIRLTQSGNGSVPQAIMGGTQTRQNE